MIGVIDIKVAAHNPNFPLEPVFTFINSAQSFRIRNVPRAVGKWNITNVFVRLSYPDNTTVQKECVLNGNIWIGTVEGCATSGTSTNGFIVTASGIDENENIITNYVLGAGDLYVKDLDGTIDPERVGTKMYFNDALPENPKKGDATFIDQTLNVYDGANWVPVAVSPDPSFIIDADGNKIYADRTVEVVEQGQITQDELALKSDLPTKTSDLTNDSGFITSAEVPTKTSDLTNDSGFITSAEIEPYHNILAPTENTGLANLAYQLALSDQVSFEPVIDGVLSATLCTNRDLTKQFRAKMGLATYYPYVMSRYNGQELSPELSLYFCKDQLKYNVGTRPRTYYEGYMFRTVGAGFAIPCSEDGTPDGRLVETTAVQPSYVLMANNTTSVHSIGFSDGSNYNTIITIDGQSDMIYARRTNAYKLYSFSEEIANKSELPTKTSDLTNDSGFITSADIITKRDLNDLNIYVDPMADMTTTKFTVVVSYAGDPSTPLYTVELTHRGGEETAWAWSPSGSNQRISIDYSSVTGNYGLHYYNLQDGGGNEHSGSMTTPLTSPYWTGEAQDDWFHFSVTSQTTTITTKAYVDSLIAQLSARITALENNNQ